MPTVPWFQNNQLLKMPTNRSGVPYLIKLGAIVTISLLVCIGVIVLLDKAMLRQTLNQQKLIPTVPKETSFVIDASELPPALKAAKPAVSE